MPIITLPQRGQPIDFNYIYTIVKSLNDLTTSISKQSNNMHVTSADGSTESVDSTSMAIDVAKQTVSGTTVSASKPFTGTYIFQTPFKTAPVVTITVVQNNTSPANDDAVVQITKTTTSQVDYSVSFPGVKDKSKASVSVNIIAIGVAQNK